MYSLILPLPPSTNHLQTGAGRGRHDTPKYAAWQKEAGFELIAQRRTFRNLGPGWFRTLIRIPADSRIDTDNTAKAVHDLLHRLGATPDDKWLWGSTQERDGDVTAGTCRVRFWQGQGVPIPSPSDA
jgi:Holliday junction resolvase RusA-like endonuclease